MRILIAEDDPISNKMLSKTLDSWGYDVTSVSDGDAAWQVMDTLDAPELVILDWQMPGMTGPEVCEKIRARNAARYAYVLLLTGKTDKTDIIHGLESGADDYIPKPFEPQELKARLQTGERVLSLQRDLRYSLEELKKGEENRRNFISALTHDLRTPLNSEKRALEVIFNSPEEEVSSRNRVLVESLIKNNGDILNLVNQLLETYHYESGNIVLNSGEVNLHQLVSQTILSLAPLAESKQLQLMNLVPQHAKSVLGDSAQLQRVIGNIVGNAIGNIPINSQIQVSAEEIGDFLEISISDNGPGINADLLPHIFERYYTGSGKSHKIGSGLGLSICKTIVTLHGGKIDVVSSGSGTTFKFTLPLYVASSASQTVPVTMRRLLIVDDMELARVGLKYALESASSDIEIVGMAVNGLQAVTMAESLKPDLILMDINMPEMDGITATRTIKEACPEQKIVMLTSQSQSKEVYAALSAGANGYCMKDIKTHYLLQAMDAVAQGKRWLDPLIAVYMEEALTPQGVYAPSSEAFSEPSVIVTEHFSAHLTDREVQVIRLIAAKNTNEEIAQIFHESLEKVHEYLDSILTKLAVSNRSEATVRAAQMGLIKSPH